MGNPIDVLGDKFEREVDIVGASNGIDIARYYSSDLIIGGSVGSAESARWIWSYQQRLVFGNDAGQIPGTTTDVSYVNGRDRRVYFKKIGSVWVSRNSREIRLVQLPGGWEVRSSNDEVETFDGSGRLLSVRDRNQRLISVGYGSTGQLATLTDAFDRVWNFQYVQAGAPPRPVVSSVVGPDGNSVTYSYHPTTALLLSVQYSDGARLSYEYTGLDQPLSSFPLLAKKIRTEGETATFEYNAALRGTSTGYSGGVNLYQFSYGANETYVLDPVGTSRTYSFASVHGVHRLIGISQPCASCGGASAQSYTYDTNGNVASKTDFNGFQTTYVYDLTRNLETSRTEAAGTSEARTITTQWHATWRLPTQIVEPSAGGTKTTTMTYDANGNMLTRTVVAPRNDGSSTNETRTWTYTYNAFGQMLTAKDPLNKTTTNVYAAAADTATPSKYMKGDLLSTTNAAGHVTTYNEYDKAGRLLKMTDANGLITTMTYHVRGWLASRSVNNGTTTETTSYTYDNVGQLTRVTLPDNSKLFYAYDAAHRLVGMSEQSNATPLANGNMIVTAANLQGDRILYTLDAMGNRIKEEHFDPTAALQKRRERVYDALNRLQQDVGGTNPASQITQYAYDNNGNQTSTTDPLARVTTNNYDALNRLISMVDPVNGAANATVYTYDAANNLTSVKDPKGLTTSYTYNGHNQLITQQSPDTGSTRFKYDAAGNVTAKLDAAGRCTTNTYDNLNRIATTKHFAGNLATNTAATCVNTTTTAATETITFTYDAATVVNSKGRMTRFADGTGNTAYTYDKNGRVLSKVQTTTGTTNPAKTIAYTYNAAGQLASTVTPSGQTVTYAYLQNRVIGIKVNGVDIVKGAIYEPFGPNGGWSWGNHGTVIAGSSVNQHQRVYDLDYRPIAIKSDPQGYTRNIQWDIASRILGQTDGAPTNPSAALSQTYGYDDLDRLTGFTPGAGSPFTPQQFAYDAIGNRTSLKLAAAATAGTTANTQTYTYPGASHRLQNVTGQSTKQFTYDATGNTLTETGAVGGINNFTFTFDAKNRMRTVRVGATAADTVTYSINALGQRVRKLGAGAQATAADQTSRSARFVYDEQGRLVGEYDNAGKLIQETVWMNDLPIATLRPKGANATLPLGTAGTGAATANNLGTNTAANKVNVDFFYVHPDHLGTPRVVSKPADNKRVWEWNSTPFGETAPNENPQNVAGAANQFRYNLRFPGQFFDAETGKHYNYFRDYDASLGRYLESDPIGLRGGVNTFGYGKQMPTRNTDAFGRESPTIPDIIFCLSNPYGCGMVKNCMNQAVKATQERFGRNGHNDASDAFRHCYWSCCIAKGLGVTTAAQSTTGHEMDRNNPECERNMDLFNNAIGLTLGGGGGNCDDCDKQKTQNKPEGSCGKCGMKVYAGY